MNIQVILTDCITSRLHNFKVAARKLGCTPEKALQGMDIKHEVSIDDLINAPETATSELIDEKITDKINYLLLLEALLIERMFELRPGPGYDPESDDPSPMIRGERV